jgi:hypothetical protein
MNFWLLLSTNGCAHRRTLKSTQTHCVFTHMHTWTRLCVFTHACMDATIRTCLHVMEQEQIHKWNVTCTRRAFFKIPKRTWILCVCVCVLHIVSVSWKRFDSFFLSINTFRPCPSANSLYEASSCDVFGSSSAFLTGAEAEHSTGSLVASCTSGIRKMFVLLVWLLQVRAWRRTRSCWLMRAISLFACLLFHALDVSLSLSGISETVSVGNAGTVSVLFVKPNWMLILPSSLSKASASSVCLSKTGVILHDSAKLHFFFIFFLVFFISFFKTKNNSTR